jgi:hypothetical protein
MKHKWLGYLVYSLHNDVMKLYIETDLSHHFYLYLMLRACDIKFDMTENLKKILDFRVN